MIVLSFGAYNILYVYFECINNCIYFQLKQFLRDTPTCVVPTKKDIRSSIELQKAYQHRLLIPRRPRKELWETPDELTALENESFLEWRKGLADLQEVIPVFHIYFLGGEWERIEVWSVVLVMFF